MRRKHVELPETAIPFLTGSLQKSSAWSQAKAMQDKRPGARCPRRGLLYSCNQSITTCKTIYQSLHDRFM
jgi:hypothetical protein